MKIIPTPGTLAYHNGTWMYETFDVETELLGYGRVCNNFALLFIVSTIIRETEEELGNACYAIAPDSIAWIPQNSMIKT